MADCAREAEAAPGAEAAADADVQLGQIVKEFKEFISARIGRVEEAILVTHLIEKTKVNFTSWPKLTRWIYYKSPRKMFCSILLTDIAKSQGKCSHNRFGLQ